MHLNGIAAVAHQRCHSIRLSTGVACGIDVEHIVPIVVVPRQILSQRLPASFIIIRYGSVAVFRPLPVVEDLRHSGCHTTRDASLAVGHGAIVVIGRPLVPLGLDECLDDNLRRPALHILSAQLPLMHGIHEHGHLLQPVAQSCRQVLCIEAALVGISQHGPPYSIVVSHEDRSPFGAVEDIQPRFVSYGAKRHLLSLHPQSRTGGRGAEELGCCIARLRFIQRLCMNGTDKTHKQQRCQ